MTDDTEKDDDDLREKVRKSSRERDLWYYVSVVFIFLFVLSSIAIYIVATYLTNVCDALSVIGVAPDISGKSASQNTPDPCPNLIGNWP